MKTFQDLLNGPLQGIMSWQQWDAVCDHVRNSGDAWYVYAVGHGLPEAPLVDAALNVALTEINDLLRRDHEEDYLGIAYADDLSSPALIKIYDPNNLGASCGSSGRSIPPGWVLSRQPPQPIASDIPIPNNRRRWWLSLMTRLAGP